MNMVGRVPGIVYTGGNGRGVQRPVRERVAGRRGGTHKAQQVHGRRRGGEGALGTGSKRKKWGLRGCIACHCVRPGSKRLGRAASKIAVPEAVAMVQKDGASRGNEEGASPWAGMNFGRTGQEEHKRAQYLKVANVHGSVNCELCVAIETFPHAEAWRSNKELDLRSSFYEKSSLRGNASATTILAYQQQFEVIGGTEYVDKTRQRVVVKRQSQEGCCGQRGVNVARGRRALMGMQTTTQFGPRHQSAVYAWEGDVVA
ncbi:hypothetical protein K438DRAFT_1942401 [Mycena galopus ATCC 62051]|nr:hypothetical protein K438DRAFT_1942401 [Mycena galopus ATCC 62051]